MKVCKTLALPILLYGSKIWSLRKKDKKWLALVKMKFFTMVRCTVFDCKRNEEILEGLKVEWANEKLRRYKSNWLWNVTRMNHIRMPKIMLHYRIYEWRWLGRHLKMLLDKAKTGISRPNLWWVLMTMKKGHSFIKWTNLSTFSANSSLHFMGMKFRETHSLSMFFVEFRLFRISVPEFTKMFWRSAAELMLFWLVHSHCGIKIMYFFKK